MENFRKNCREWMKECFEGEVTLTKANLWLIVLTCLLAGTIHGLKKAPATHGVMIGSNNGNTFSCGTDGKKNFEETGRGKEAEGKKEEEGKCGRTIKRSAASGRKNAVREKGEANGHKCSTGEKGRNQDIEKECERKKGERNENHIKRRFREGV